MIRFVLAVGLIATSVHAQTLVRETSGHYRLTYTDLDGVTRSVAVEAIDLVAPRLIATISESGSILTYGYVLQHLAVKEARSPIAKFDIPCAEPLSVAAPSSWNVLSTGRDGFCKFLFRDGYLERGGTLRDVAITSRWLPVIADVRVYGATDGVLWPSEAGTVPSEAYRLADGVRGRSGGWYRLPAVVPGRDPEEFGDAARGLSLLRADLGRACELSWISSRGICNSLDRKLDNAQRSHAAGNASATRGQLDAFRNELSAQRGKHVDDNAYALLITAADRVAGGLAAGPR